MDKRNLLENNKIQTNNFYNQNYPNMQLSKHSKSNDSILDGTTSHQFIGRTPQIAVSPSS